VRARYRADQIEEASIFRWFMQNTPETTPSTPPTPPTRGSTPPPPLPPPDLVRVRTDITGADYRALRHISIETGVSVADLMSESARLLIRWYRAQGLSVEPPTP
jgi:hypothetical protein